MGIYGLHDLNWSIFRKVFTVRSTKDQQEKTNRRPIEDQWKTNRRTDLKKTNRRPAENKQMTYIWPTDDQHKTYRWPRDDQQMIKRWPTEDQHFFGLVCKIPVNVEQTSTVGAKLTICHGFHFSLWTKIQKNLGFYYRYICICGFLVVGHPSWFCVRKYEKKDQDWIETLSSKLLPV